MLNTRENKISLNYFRPEIKYFKKNIIFAIFGKLIKRVKELFKLLNFRQLKSEEKRAIQTVYKYCGIYFFFTRK